MIIKPIIFIFVVVIIVMAIFLIIPNKPEVTDFETCASAGNPIMESYPRRCRANDITYIEEINVPAPEDQNLDFFINQIQEKGVENLGAHPIEGFNPELYKRAFPGLIDSDFEGTDAIGGIWEFENNELKFSKSSPQGLITSADGTLTNKGLEALLKNLEIRLNTSPDSKENINKIINMIETSPTEDIEIENDFGSKIVYSFENSNLDLLRKDCNDRAGTFNECGGVCAPNTENCILVCGLTCENIPQ